MLDAHCQAVSWAEDHPRETAGLIVDALGGFDVNVVEASLDASKVRMDCRVDHAEIARMADIMAAQGLIDAAPASDGWRSTWRGRRPKRKVGAEPGAPRAIPHGDDFGR